MPLTLHTSLSSNALRRFRSDTIIYIYILFKHNTFLGHVF